MKRTRGFTLIEILIVLAIIGILAALLFPVFKGVRERANQAACMSNLHQIGLAVAMYRQDEKEFPASIVALLPDNAKILNTSGAPNIGGTPSTCDTDVCTNAQGTGYLKSTSVLVCADDDDDTTPHTSYGDISTKVPSAYNATKPQQLLWNYWGYQQDGYAFPDWASVETGARAVDCVNPAAATWAYRTNPVKYSLSNRFAPGDTIITRCIYHRTQTSDLATPSAKDRAPGARDMILYVEGNAKSVDISVPKFDDWRTATTP